MERIFGDGSDTTQRWKPEPRERGTYSILSTCIITLALCVWTAVHLNLPEHRGFWPQIRRKCGWMMLGFLAPELVVFTAYQQFMEARRITKHMRSLPSWSNDKDRECASEEGRSAGSEDVRQWTRVHGHFAAMGGFAFEIRDGPGNFFPIQGDKGARRTRLALTGDGLISLAESYPELIPELTRERIQDKSKGSMLAKSLVCFQAAWFCVQCLSRFAQRMPISLLELNTFGHAVCTLLIYCVWWEKPLDIEEPEIIPVRNEDVEKVVASMCVSCEVYVDSKARTFRWRGSFSFNVYCWPGMQRSQLGNRHGVHSLAQTFWRLCWMITGSRRYGSKLPERFVLTVDSGETTESPPPAGAEPADATTRIELGQTLHGITLYSHHHRAYPHRQLPFVDLPHADMRRWRLALQEREAAPAHTVAGRVRNSPRLGNPRAQWPLYLTLGVVGLAYGGLHCLAWGAPFPTDLERLFWRISSVTITSTGVLIALGLSWAYIRPLWVTIVCPSGMAADLLDPVIDAILSLLRARHPSPPDELVPKKRKDGGLLVYVVDIGVALVDLALYVLLLVAKLLFDVVVVGLIVFYTLARVYLVVECFINLSHLPDGAYKMPQWSQYVPHIA